TPGGAGSNACQNNRCTNGGSCAVVPGGGYRCLCRAGFTGIYCDISFTAPGGSQLTACLNNRCENGASCENVPGGGYHCICRPGFIGQFCAYQISG
ncbi:unnamed protein product, partial [Rotaria socialis]